MESSEKEELQRKAEQATHCKILRPRPRVSLRDALRRMDEDLVVLEEFLQSATDGTRSLQGKAELLNHQNIEIIRYDEIKKRLFDSQQSASCFYLSVTREKFIKSVSYLSKHTCEFSTSYETLKEITRQLRPVNVDLPVVRTVDSFGDLIRQKMDELHSTLKNFSDWLPGFSHDFVLASASQETLFQVCSRRSRLLTEIVEKM